jgi:DNA-binding PadR family transcriptional regulator
MTTREAVNPRQILTPVALHILLSLADGERHGYGIKLEVEDRTRGSLTLGPATLYEAIHRMEKAGWIEVTDPPPNESPGRGNHRKYYCLTTEGRRQLHAELHRLNEIVRFAKSKKLFSESRPS